MEEPKEHIDDQFKDSFEDFELEIEPKVWDHIEEELHPKKEKKGIVIWWMASAAAVLIGFIFLWPSNEDFSAPMASNLKEIKEEIQENSESDNKMLLKENKLEEEVVEKQALKTTVVRKEREDKVEPSKKEYVQRSIQEDKKVFENKSDEDMKWAEGIDGNSSFDSLSIGLADVYYSLDVAELAPVTTSSASNGFTHPLDDYNGDSTVVDVLTKLDEEGLDDVSNAIAASGNYEMSENSIEEIDSSTLGDIVMLEEVSEEESFESFEPVSEKEEESYSYDEFDGVSDQGEEVYKTKSVARVRRYESRSATVNSESKPLDIESFELIQDSMILKLESSHLDKNKIEEVIFNIDSVNNILTIEFSQQGKFHLEIRDEKFKKYIDQVYVEDLIQIDINEWDAQFYFIKIVDLGGGFYNKEHKFRLR